MYASAQTAEQFDDVATDMATDAGTGMPEREQRLPTALAAANIIAGSIGCWAVILHIVGVI